MLASGQLRRPPRITGPALAAACFAITMCTRTGLANSPPPASAPDLRPVQMRFEDGAPPTSPTNWVAITLHPPPPDAWIPPEAPARDLLSERASWRQRDVPAMGSLADIAPPDAATARPPGWLTEETDEDAEESAIGKRESMRRGWLADSVSRLQARSAIDEAQDVGMWDEMFADDDELSEDFQIDPGMGRDPRSWAPGWQESSGSRAFWEDVLDHPDGFSDWRDNAANESRAGQGNLTRPAFGTTDDER